MEKSKKDQTPKDQNSKKILTNSRAKKIKTNLQQKPSKQTHEQVIAKLKAKISQLEQSIANLERQNIVSKLENQKNIHDFQLKAKEFEAKAVAQVNKIKSELNEKFIEDEKHLKKYNLQKFFESIIKPFTNLIQAIEFGANSTDTNVKAYVIGFEMYINQLLNEFNDFGIVQIKPQVGEEFNPEIHRVLSLVSGHKKNHIVEIKQNGFKFHDRVIKPADVIVGQ